MRVLFFNEGNSGSHIMGLAQGEAAMRVGLGEAPDVDARFVSLAPMGRGSPALATRRGGPLSRMKVDFHTLRWHVVQSLRARAQLRRELGTWPAEVVYVKTQSIALAMSGLMSTVPIVLSVDATVRGWWEMPAWVARHGSAPATIAPSAALERRAMRRAALVLAWTAWTRRDVEREGPGARVVEHHPGIDLQRYLPAPRRH